MKIVQNLVEEGLISEIQAKAVEMESQRTGKKQEEIIIEKNLLSEDDLFKFKSDILKIPFKNVDPIEIQDNLFEIIPKDTAKVYKFVPIGGTEKKLDIGMVYPEDLQSQQALRFLSTQKSFQYKVFLISISNYNQIFKKYLGLERKTKELLSEIKIEEKPKEETKAKEAISRISEKAPIVKIVSSLLESAVEKNASDIHIEPLEEKIRIRFRINGELNTVLELPYNLLSSLVARIKILSNLRIDETRLPQDGRFSQEILKRKIDFRVATFPTLFGEKVAIRILDPRVGLKKYTEIGLTEKNFETIQEFLKKPYGLILAVGPTGSGKTTTLYSLLRELNKTSVNIVTIEDPIEYSIEGVNQSQVNSVIGYTFSTALRQVLRQDPDIIMVGEIRDTETASLAIHAGLTGHIVLSTLHTNDAPGAIPRLIDMGVPKFLIPSALSLVISQRLVRVLCPYCKKKVQASPKIEKYIQDVIANFPEDLKEKVKFDGKIYKSKGCKKCNFGGYIGRTGIFEVLKMTDSLAKVIVEDPSKDQIIKEARNQKMISLKEDGILKVLKGETSIEEIIRVTG